jgi:hypothetical protein
MSDAAKADAGEMSAMLTNTVRVNITGMTCQVTSLRLFNSLEASLALVAELGTGH